jgi:hypothetical protein
VLPIERQQPREDRILARTAIFSFVPYTGINDMIKLLISTESSRLKSAFFANFNSICFDFSARQKVGGTHLSSFVVKQLPVFPPETYTPALLAEIVPRVLALVYTAHDLAPFARDCGYDGPPFVWNEARRAHPRAELDAIYAHFYGLDRDDFAYVLDTFEGLNRRLDRAANAGCAGESPLPNGMRPGRRGRPWGGSGVPYPGQAEFSSSARPDPIIPSSSLLVRLAHTISPRQWAARDRQFADHNFDQILGALPG